ncbi:MAG: HK97 gp10 family phage protein [Clostridiales bacterium]|nr:HK97 gp10 family phage protein [Clostridiales bacterium]
MLLDEKLCILGGDILKIRFEHDKDFFKDVEERLKKKIDKKRIKSILEDIGDMGVDMLAEATPVDTGTTAESWQYEIIEESDSAAQLCFFNDNEVDGMNVAILLQYGHGTRNGGYVPGDDYINPVLSELAEELHDTVAEEVKL